MSPSLAQLRREVETLARRTRPAPTAARRLTTGETRHELRKILDKHGIPMPANYAEATELRSLTAPWKGSSPPANPPTHKSAEPSPTRAERLLVISNATAQRRPGCHSQLSTY